MFSRLREKLRRISDHLIESPCIAVCKLDAERKYCTGCYRLTEEIEGWPTMSGNEKHAVIRAATERRERALS